MDLSELELDSNMATIPSFIDLEQYAEVTLYLANTASKFSSATSREGRTKSLSTNCSLAGQGFQGQQW